MLDTTYESDTLILLDLEMEDGPKCEGIRHPEGVERHSDDSPLLYIYYTGECRCAPGNDIIHVRCKGNVDYMLQCETLAGYLSCTRCGKAWNIHVVGPVES